LRYGFVIDQNRCIGCHACTVACKEEHNVPVGVFRTWVKYIEKGEFPDVSRHFAVLRCNHCDNAPCVEICPTAALYRRPDGIVDFDNSRCIGCKSCMQACPYDALYIDPKSNTAAKCNYCAHRVESGLEPACVIVCPTQAIIPGDLDDPASRISRTVAAQKVVARKPHKGTQPKLFYVGVEGSLLHPSTLQSQGAYLWAERRADEDIYVEGAANGQAAVAGGAREVYDVAHPAPWGALAAAYLWTKSIGAGALIVAATLAIVFGIDDSLTRIAAPLAALAFTGLTALILIVDLKRPDRFYFLLTKPNFSSWLVWGCYILMAYSAAAFVWLACGFAIGRVSSALEAVGAILGLAAAGYTAFLFAQAKGRELWQSPLFLWHLIVQAIVAGAALLLLAAIFMRASSGSAARLVSILDASLILGLLMTLVELHLPAVSEDVRRAAELVTRGALRAKFWGLSVLVGVMVPVAVSWLAAETTGGPADALLILAALAALGGLAAFEWIWIEAGQAVPLS
jgi:Fe-S-cluster-containing dehydrogenase component/formate-dependent nitrite reductase membrane component NrfD